MRLLAPFRSILVACWLSTFCVSAKSAPDAPVGLMCNLLAHPELTVISGGKPHFGWIVSDTRRGAKQSAYHIIISSTREAVERNRGDVWDSGKLLSTQSIDVPYNGDSLALQKTYFWRVRTWDAEGHASPFSSTQELRTGQESKPGLLPPRDFANRYPIERTRIVPHQFTPRSNGVYFADFGKAAFGTVELKIANDVASRSIEVHLGEVIAADGSIDKKPGGSRRYRKMILPLELGERSYTVVIPSDARNSSGAAIKVNEFMPDVMPFRYCELVGVPKGFKQTDIVQVAAHYRFDDAAATFSSSDKVLNEVWDLCKYSIKATSFTGVYIDGDRERIPYEGDAYINQLCHYAMDREYSLARYSTEYLIAHPTWPAEWQMHMPLMAWNDYLYTGNRDLLAAHYEDLAAKTLIGLAREDGLIVEDKSKMTAKFKSSLHLDQDIRVVVDWPASSKANPVGERDGYDMKPVNTVANAFHYRTLIVMKKIADALGKTAEAAKWEESARKVKASFNHVFFNAQKRCYVDAEGSDHSALHANMFALAFDLIPTEHIPAVIEFIKSRGMACSVYGAQHLLDGLYHAGAADYALSLLTATNDRSWFHMKEAGSTIAMEAWDNKYKENQDWNHAWGAAPANVIPRLLMGIEPIEAGFPRVRIRPQLGSLRQASLLHPTIRGPITLEVLQKPSTWSATVTIPANMTAEFHVPVVDAARVKESKRTVAKSPFVKFLRAEQGSVVFEIPGGTYAFEAALPNN